MMESCQTVLSVAASAPPAEFVTPIVMVSGGPPSFGVHVTEQIASLFFKPIRRTLATCSRRQRTLKPRRGTQSVDLPIALPARRTTAHPDVTGRTVPRRGTSGESYTRCQVGEHSFGLTEAR